MCRTQKYLEAATFEAQKSDMLFKHGAVLVKGGSILSRGHNHLRSRIFGVNYCSTHAEMQCLNPKQLKQFKKNKAFGGEIYVVRVSADGTYWLNSRPCYQCIKWMFLFGIKKVYFSLGSEFHWSFEKISNLVSYVWTNSHQLTIKQKTLIYITKAERCIRSNFSINVG